MAEGPNTLNIYNPLYPNQQLYDYCDFQCSYCRCISAHWKRVHDNTNKLIVKNNTKIARLKEKIKRQQEALGKDLTHPLEITNNNVSADDINNLQLLVAPSEFPSSQNYSPTYTLIPPPAVYNPFRWSEGDNTPNSPLCFNHHQVTYNCCDSFQCSACLGFNVYWKLIHEEKKKMIIKQKAEIAQFKVMIERQQEALGRKLTHPLEITYNNVSADNNNSLQLSMDHHELGILQDLIFLFTERNSIHEDWEIEHREELTGNLNDTSSARWEFPREKVRLRKLIGQGSFGQVWSAEADDIIGYDGSTRLVAVKTVTDCFNLRERGDILRELSIMQDLGSHPNIVSLLGCCSVTAPYYLIMEYVKYGKLLAFLRYHRTKLHLQDSSDVIEELTPRDLTVFSYCIAKGMDYLSNKGIIHRDLAARSVLVDHNKMCKISDFGMSRYVSDAGQIDKQGEKTSEGTLSPRWTAPESLNSSLFTHKSDVWSFGILLWEIATLGSSPYGTMSDQEVMRRVREGYRLEKPQYCRKHFFRVMSKCWHLDPNKRPNFAELKQEIGEIHGDFSKGRGCVCLEELACANKLRCAVG